MTPIAQKCFFFFYFWRFYFLFVINFSLTPLWLKKMWTPLWMFLTPSQNECESIVNKKGWNLSWGEDSQGASDPGGNSAWRGRNIWSWLMLIQNCDWINEIYVYSIIFKFLKESNPEQNQCASFTLKIARGDHIPGGWDIRGDTFQPCEGVLVSPVYPPPPPEKETLGGRQWVSLSRLVCPRGQTICHQHFFEKYHNASCIWWP